MVDIEKSLQEAGLSNIEAKVYLTILAHGRLGAGKAAQLTHHYRANVYQAIERLKAKGLISEMQGKTYKLYEALSPQHLVAIVERKKEVVQNIIPLLLQMKATTMEIASMRVITGVQGWKHLLDEFLEIGKERVVYGIPKESSQLQEFYKVYHKKRAQKKIWLRHLFNHGARERITITNTLPYTESRILPKELNQPVATSICGSLVALTVYQGKSILTLVIENPMIAKAYRAHFEYLWKQADTQ